MDSESGEEPVTELRCLHWTLPVYSESTAAGKPVLSFNQWTNTCPIRSELHNSILVCICISQSELLDSGQSKLYEFGNLICTKWTIWKPGWGLFL